ncbi:MAG: 30S ribosomal protein S27e [Crenarchaeota archaeon]|nr:30S ribosomal protein S27e [Thermoproteota archaeon]MCR8453502.1 30S ribosomal protein S27e [Thermoproteota archaeon]MCR8454854.1 30S ribosomal protein S27e [Thermoproteota archaeon]MCR8462740.1 30S ribosomal protein S27e [Thermoproteota archaeon]MCR8471100.1 30S ribosomal protein S27e [Thermoproteota archaeon]
MAHEIQKILEELTEEERKIARFPRSTFLKVRCKNCGYTIVTFSHASTKVSCPNCGKLIVQPTGGKAKIDGEVIEEYYY